MFRTAFRIARLRPVGLPQGLPLFSRSYLSNKLPPAMKQYQEIKDKYPDHIVLFQLGDFFEMFHDDAAKASQLLDIQLTRKRQKETAKEESPIPMAGIPVGSLRDYMGRFLKSGHKVVLVEQTEDSSTAKLAKRVVKREVTRIITPGTLFDEFLLDPRLPNHLLAVSPPSSLDELLGLAWIDASTGQLHLASCTEESLPAELARIQPVEVLLPSTASALGLLAQLKPYYTTRVAPGKASDLEIGRSRRDFPFKFQRTELRSVSMLFSYLQSTNKAWSVDSVTSIEKGEGGDFLSIDASTRQSLELTSTGQGRRGSLLQAIDQTSTPGGARLLRSRLQSPLVNSELIERRLSEVEYFRQHVHLREEVKLQLKECQDCERSLQRLSLDKGNTRDLLALAHSLNTAENIKKLFTDIPQPLEHLLERFGSETEFVARVFSAIVPNPPLLLSDGNFIREGYSAQLDEARELRDNGKKKLTDLLQQYRESTGLQSLKLKSTLIGGHYFEINAEYHTQLDPTLFLHFATMKGGMRYKTRQLIELESKLNEAGGLCQQLELELFEQLRRVVVGNSENLLSIATGLNALDVAVSLGEVAHQRNYCRPTFVESGVEFTVERGRHAAVEQTQANTTFVENDCVLEEASRAWLVTGPNMGGKSTFLRQNALIVVLAQAGCFVPAHKAQLSLVDRLFTRIGSSDDLTNDRSTFMVEMLEAAQILNTATERSFVIVDELGRGTTSVEGFAIAKAMLEHLHNRIRCRLLFATHFLQLASAGLPALRPKRLAVREEEEQEGVPVFLHKVEDGVASHSYGIYCAQLAGVPASVIDRAKEIRQEIEVSRSP